MSENPLENIENRPYTMDINKVNNTPSAIRSTRNYVQKAFLCLFFCPLRQKGMCRRLFLVQAWDMALRVELVRRIRRHRRLHGVGVGHVPQGMAGGRRRVLRRLMGHARIGHASHGGGGKTPNRR